MPASESLHQTGGFWPGAPAPVVTQLASPIGLEGSGRLWAQVGQTALAAAGQAGDMIMKSPLNPAVKAQMQYNVAQYNAAQDHIKWLNSQGVYGQMLQATGQGGLETVPGGAGNVNPMLAMRLMTGPPKPLKPPPPAPAPESSTAPPGMFLNPATGSYEPLQEPKPATGPAPKPQEANPELPVNPGDLLSSRGGSRPYLSASTDRGPIPTTSTTTGVERQPIAAYRAEYAAQHPEGAPQGMFMNPATGSYEQIQPPAAPTTQPPAQTTPPGSAIPSQFAPPRPMTPSPQDMANWQAQNAHPVADSQSALDWAKRFHTGYKTATYLPHGGPNGEPAYNFSDGKSSNIVPISQMVQNGFGPTVAAQSTSSVLSAAERIQQAGQGATGPGLPLGPVSPAQPGAPPGQGAQYPTIAQDQTAPGPPAPSQGPPQGGQVWNPLRPSPLAPPPAPGAYNPTAYQMPQGSTVTQTGAVNPALMAGGSNEQAAAAAKAAATNPAVDTNAPPVKTDTPVPQITPEEAQDNIFSKGYSPAELAKMEEDPIVSNFAGFTWKQDRRFGNFYAVQRSPSNIFREERFNWGRDSWEDTATENSGIQQELHDYVATVPGINYTDAQIAAMSPAKIMAAINEAKKFKATASDPAGAQETLLNGKTELVKIAQRLISQVEAAQKAGMDTTEFRDAVRSASEHAAQRNAIMPVIPGQKLTNVGDFPVDPGQFWPFLQAAAHGSQTGASGGKTNPFVDNLAQEVQNLDKVGAKTPGIIIQSHERSASPFNLNGVELPISGKVSDIKEIANIFSGASYDTILRGLKTFTQRMTEGLADSYDSAVGSGYRVNNNQRANREALRNNQPIPDDTDLFKDGTIPKDMQSPSKTTTTQTTPTTGQHVYQDTTDPSFIRATKPPVEVSSVEEATNFAKTKPRGTYFNLNGHTYMVQ